MIIKLTKTESTFLKKLDTGLHSEIITNPFSGKKVLLDPIGVALYDFLKGAEYLGSTNNVNMAKDIFIKLFPEAYMDLID